MTSTLRIPAQTEQVRVARMVAVAAARRAGVSQDDLDDVRLAAGEAVGRAVVRQRAAAAGSGVIVELVEGPGTFEIAVTDDAGDLDADDEFAMAVIAGLVPEVDTVTVGRTGRRLVLRWAV